MRAIDILIGAMIVVILRAIYLFVETVANGIGF